MLILASLTLLGLRVNIIKFLLSGFCLGLITMIARHFLFNIGWHTPVILASLIVILVVVFNLSISTAVTGCFLSFFLLLMGESFLMSPILSLTKISFQTIINNPWLHVAFGWISDGFLIIGILVCALRKKPLIKAPEAVSEQ